MPSFSLLGQPTKVKPAGGKKKTITVVATGGALLGATFVGTASIFTPDFSGAVLAGETIQAAIGFSITATGGPKLGATNPTTPFPGGGPVLGGTFAPEAVFAVVATGGAKLGGLQPQSGVFPVSFTGGPILGGSFSTHAPEFLVEFSGGTVLIGTARYGLAGTSSGGIVMSSDFNGDDSTVTPLIAASPGSIELSTTLTISIVGQNTTFEDTPPDFAISGVAGVSISGGSLVVIDQTHATIEIVSGTTPGTATITDATSGATTTLTVRTSPPPFAAWHRSRLARRRGDR